MVERPKSVLRLDQRRDRTDVCQPSYLGETRMWLAAGAVARADLVVDHNFGVTSFDCNSRVPQQRSPAEWPG